MTLLSIIHKLLLDMNTSEGHERESVAGLGLASSLHLTDCKKGGGGGGGGGGGRAYLVRSQNLVVLWTHCPKHEASVYK